jgi:hypothetical protein
MLPRWRRELEEAQHADKQHGKHGILRGGVPAHHRPAVASVDLRRDAAILTGGEDLELVLERREVAAIAGIGDALEVAGITFSVWPS